MSKVFEVFGYPLNSTHPKAKKCRTTAWCPFMGNECDGGGNRYLAALNLSKHPALAEKFIKSGSIHAGVCSLSIREKPWIVCPRRLLTLGGANLSELQSKVRDALVRYGGLSPANEYRIWSEVRMRGSIQTKNSAQRFFDYTFDYILAGKCHKPLSEISLITGKSERICERIAVENHFTLARRSGKLWVDDFPADPIVIVEIMTSSTSGGNKAKRTRIGMAFEDAILKGDDHKAPGINYRQVWARMVSQLLAKSQVGLAWDGKTIWILQDVLADYISSSTGLNLRHFISEAADEVNLLSFGYGDSPKPNSISGVIQLKDPCFYSGPIETTTEDHGGKGSGFVDIVKAGTMPPKEQLWRSLFLKSSCGVIN